MVNEANFQWIRPYLQADETVLWRGKPEKLHLLSAQDAFMIPFSLLWAGFAVFWETMVIVHGAPWFFPVFGGFFVLIGLYITVGRFLWKAYVLKRTLYAITDRKVLIKHLEQVEILQIKDFPPQRVKQYRDGTATIYFCSPPSLFSRFEGRTAFPNYREWQMLHGVSEPERLLSLLQNNAAHEKERSPY